MKKSPPLYDDVLGYFAYLPFVAPVEEILALLKIHGRALARKRAVVLSALLVKLCTGDYASLLPSNHPATSKGGKGSADSSSVKLAKDTGSKSTKSTAVPMDVLKPFSHMLGADIVVPTERLPITEVMYLFTADEVSLLSLLEGFVDASQGRILPSKVTMTLMEMYLVRYSERTLQLQALQDGDTARADLSEVEDAQQVTENLVMGLLDGAHVQYDPAHALLLCHSFAFERGLRFLLEKQQSTELLMRMLIQGNDVKEVFKVLRREGTKDPELYIQVLTYFVQQSIVSEDGRGKEGDENVPVVRRESSDSMGSEEEENSEDDEER